MCPRAPIVLSVLALLAMWPAIAAATVESDCVYVGNRMGATAQQCGASFGVIGSDVIACLSAHETEFGQVASFCVTAAENHYETAATLHGYASDREFIQGATYLGLAATANEYLNRRDLALSQIKSVIAISARVKSDPDAGDVAPLAAKEFTWANSVLQAMTAPR